MRNWSTRAWIILAEWICGIVSSMKVMSDGFLGGAQRDLHSMEL